MNIAVISHPRTASRYMVRKSQHPYGGIHHSHFVDSKCLTIAERSFTPHEDKVADELIRERTTSAVTGIVEFDGEKIGDGKVG